MRRVSLVWLVLLCACSASAKSAQEDLLEGVRDFQEGLRWRNYDQAAHRVPAASRERFLDAHEELDDDLRIDDYEIERVTVEKDRDRAMVRVSYTWHLDTVGTVHETTVDEAWERQGKVWRIVSATYRRGEPLPPETLAVESTPSELP